MDSRLSAAVTKGKQQRKDKEALIWKKRERLAEEKRQQIAKNADKIRAKISIVFDLITEATANGDHSIVISPNTLPGIYDMQALCRVVEKIEGLRAVFQSGEDYINSDEVKEHWETCTIEWNK